MSEPTVRCPVCNILVNTERSRILRSPVFRYPPLFAAGAIGIYYFVFHNFIYAVIWAILSATEISPWIIVPPAWYGVAAVGARFFIAYRFIYPPVLHGAHLFLEEREKEAKSLRPQIIAAIMLMVLLDIPGRLLLKLLGG